jgi:hypothetical protein
MSSRIVKAGAAGAALLVLAACDGSAAGNGQAKQVRIANRPNERLLALDDESRRIGLVRAIRGNRQRCPRRVEPNPVYQGEFRGMAYWTARCDNNEQYAIFIAPNEIVQVRKCRHMAELDMPPCRELPPAEPNRERPRTKS